MQIAEDDARRRSAAAAWDAHLPTAVAADTVPGTASRDEESSAALGVDPISKALAKLAAAGASNDRWIATSLCATYSLLYRAIARSFHTLQD